MGKHRSYKFSLFLKRNDTALKFYSLNEFNLLSYVLKALAGRQVYVLAIDPCIPGNRAIIEKVLHFLKVRGLTSWASKVIPALARYETGFAEISFAHLYPRFEPEIRSYYQLDKELQIGAYSLIFKHAASCHVKSHIERIPQLRDLEPELAARQVELVGLPYDLCALYEIFYGHSLPRSKPSGRRMRRFMNFVFIALIFATAVGNTLRRTRLAVAQTAKTPLGADLAEEGRVRPFFKQISTDPAEILYVMRNDAVRDKLADDELARYRHASLSEGRLPLSEMPSTLWMIFRDSVLLFGNLSWLPGPVFFSVVKQINKRISFRAFFRRFQFNGFLARDEYNTDHITRSQELRRRGICSLGLLHGMATAPRVYPHLRYLDFDTIYLFGKRQGEAYAETWPSQMRVRSFGGYSLTRDQLQEVGQSASHDILLFGNQWMDPPAHIHLLTELARSFPDRKIYLKLKYSRDYIGADIHNTYLQQFGELPSNVEVTTEPPYQLMLKSGYAFSGLSTVIAEALEIGLITYFLDVYRPDQDVFFRDFPDLCLASSQEAIERVRAHENGTAVYPREQFGDLVDLSDQNVFDQIREELELPPWPNTQSNVAA